jgi:hypothetical protein
MEINKKIAFKNKKQENSDININININNATTLNKNHSANNSTKTIKTNYTLNTNNLNENKINSINNQNDKNRPISSQSELSTFTHEELMSVPRYSLPNSMKSKSKRDIKSNTSSNSNIINKTFYKNNSTNKDPNINSNISNQNQKPKTPFNQINKNPSKRNSTSSNNLSNSLSSIPSGKKTIPPIKKPKNNINLKSKSNQNVDLFDDDANPINMSKYRGARKDLVKLKMGGKSKVHELFVNKPRNFEENEKIKKKFMEFIKEGKEDNKNPDINANKKSVVRKKIEDAQKFKNNKFSNK